MKFELKELSLKNFKKAKKLDINFGAVTNINGANRTGKTTVLDAFLYLLFGVDSQNSSKFEVKTLDENNQTTPKIDVVVEALICIDGKNIKIGRTLREDWKPVKNSNETYRKGHNTIYMWNDIEGIKESEFNQNRDELIDKNLFKLLTSVTYFTSLGEMIQRDLLMSLVSDIDNNSILALMENKTDFLLKIINENEDFENAKKSLAGKIARIKKELKEIQPRIDQSETLKPDVQNWEKLNTELEHLNSELEKIKEQLDDKSKVLTEFNEGRIKVQENLNTRFFKLTEQKNILLTGSSEKKNDLNTILFKQSNEKKVLSVKMKTINEELQENLKQIESTTKKRAELLAEYKKQNESTFVFDVENGNCENCGKVLDNIEEIKIDALQKFETKRTKRLNELKTEGAPLTKKVATLQDRNNMINASLIDINSDIVELGMKIELSNKNLSELGKVDPLQDKTYQEIKTTYEADKLAFDKETSPTVDNLALLTKRTNTNHKIDDLKALIATKKEIEKIDKAIKELQDKEKKQVAEIMNLEADLFSMEQFNKLKVEHLEGEVNKLFSFTKFKMFETQINGIEKPICKATFEGVTFGSLNNEAKINVGLDIINVFSKHHNISAPVFIDNRESVTEIIPIDTQIINLIVDPSAKELVIN